jgi:PAS domain S-box-containing protein
LAQQGDGGAASTLAIVAVSALLGMLIGWRAPGLDRYAQDWLMRARGTLSAPDDIAIIAIDETSVARLGRFPWPRSVMGRVIDAVAAAQPKAIALDILFADPTQKDEDGALARSIAHAANVVVAAQLVEPQSPGGEAAWLLPVPDIGRAAAAIGHVNVATESEGVAREFLFRTADDTGRPLRAISIETVRVGERVTEEAVADTGRALVVGSRALPMDPSAPPVVFGHAADYRNPAQILRTGCMMIDYIGPAGSFSPNTYSLVDVLDGRVRAETFRGRYVLIGATAASIGERYPSPFVHHADVRGDQHGTLMPGVEVLANALNTILRSRFYSRTPDWLALVWAALAAGLTLLLLAASQGRYAFVKQMSALAGMGGVVVLLSYVSFARFLVVPPLLPGLVSFASAGLLGLVRRSLVTSSRLDANIAEIARAGYLLAPAGKVNAAACAIAKMVDAAAVAIFASQGEGRYLLVAHYGAAVQARLSGIRAVALPSETGRPSAFFTLPPNEAQSWQLMVRYTDPDRHALVIAHTAGHTPWNDSLRLCTAIAAGCACLAETALEPRRLWPTGLEGKARTLGQLNARFLHRARFMDLALRSVEDGLIIAGPDGNITFVNRSAARILESTEHGLAGRSLFERLAEVEYPAPAAREPLARLLLDRTPIEREVAIRGSRTRQYVLRLAAVYSGDGPALGIVASLSDITRQKELQQTKNDVISLVSHEMRTPLAAIQGMSELLANYDLDPERRREMNLAVNEEVKRLTSMITEYLDITRLESGVVAPRLTPVRVEVVLERTLLLLDPVAAQRGIRLARIFTPNMPAVLADPDLLSRAVSNLVSNAIKYSPPRTGVTVFLRARRNDLLIEVTDEGYGIPAPHLDRIFEKFYRVPRAQDADVPGTGLGLALVREIAELHGWSILVESEEDAGSTFTLAIPLKDQAVE